MKKVMALFGFLSVGFFFWHSFLSVRYFYGNIPYTPALDYVGWMLAACVCVHMVPALINRIRNAVKMKNQRIYQRYIMDSAIQNITGISLVGFLILHVLAIELHKALASDITGTIWWAVDLLFFLTAFIHMAIALPHLLITYGIVTRKIPYKIARAVIFTLSLFGFVMLGFSRTVFLF